jgi:hypothetical protein
MCGGMENADRSKESGPALSAFFFKMLHELTTRIKKNGGKRLFRQDGRKIKEP